VNSLNVDPELLRRQDHQVLRAISDYIVTSRQITGILPDEPDKALLLEIDQLKTQLIAHDRQDLELNSRIASVQTDYQNAVTDRLTLERKIAADASMYEAREKEFSQKLQASVNESAQLRTYNNQLTQQLESARTGIDVCREEATKWRLRVGDLEEEVRKARSRNVTENTSIQEKADIKDSRNWDELNLLRKQVAWLEKEIEIRGNQLESVTATKQAQILTLTTQLREAEVQASTASAQVISLRRENSAIQERVDQLDRKLQEELERKIQLETRFRGEIEASKRVAELWESKSKEIATQATTLEGNTSS